MAGFAGIIGQIRPKDAIDKVELMLGAMNRDALYRQDIYVNEELGLYIGWAVHRDSFTDCMPLRSADGNATLILSGEIFSAGSDASHLPSLYQKLGEKFFEELNGTFCGVLLNSQSKKVQLFNDRMGFEKLYFAEPSTGELFHFATEAKVLLRVLPRHRELDRQGLAQFFSYGSTLQEKTLFKGISLLPPASVWEFSPSAALQKRTYFRPEDWQPDNSIGPDAFQNRFRETFNSILPRYFKGKRPSGISLTGGWDTRMIMACHRVKPHSLPCYTFAGESGETLDVRQARKVADMLKLDHRVLRLEADFLERFSEHAERTVYGSDGNGDVCLSHEIYLNRLAAGVAGARVTGNFGSEVLRGVSTFKEIPSRSEWLNGELKADIAQCRENWNTARKEIDETYFAVFQEIPWKLSTTFRLANSQLPTRSPFLDNEVLKLASICPLPIRRKSAFHIELIRSECPELLSIPTDRGDAGDASSLPGTLRRAFYSGTFKVEYRLNEGMPNNLTYLLDSIALYRALPFRHKYLEYRRWFRGPLRGYMDEMLNNGNSFATGVLGRKAVERILSDHVSGRSNRLEQINIWLTLELIHRSLLRAQD